MVKMPPITFFVVFGISRSIVNIRISHSEFFLITNKNYRVSPTLDTFNKFFFIMTSIKGLSLLIYIYNIKLNTPLNYASTS